MEKLTSPVRVANLLEQFALKPRKHWGQNFLVDENILRKILDAAALEQADHVLEIGPGLGVLTASLAEKAAGVIAIEIDKGLIRLLEETLGHHTNTKFIQADVRKLDLRELCLNEWGEQRVKVIANLPFYLTTPFVFRLLQEGPVLERAVIMVQHEVGERMVALPGSSGYGVLSILCRYYTTPKLLFKVSRNVFYPRPAVDSAVVALFASPPSVDVGDEPTFWKLVKGSFHQRRKTILNGLLASFPLQRQEAEGFLMRSGIALQLRPENLSLEQLAKLSRLLYNLRESK